ncbi:MAG: 4Fe-4S dicluster domain-containing protein [Dehalococcoidia bacterium]
MLEALKGLKLTLTGAARSKVTAEYPKEHLPVHERYMGFPALTWDAGRDEAYCTGCRVCVRACPTQCMTATMKDNPKFEAGDSHRRKIIDEFEINFGRCILCGICVEVCNFDAIEMSHEHERGTRHRDGNRVSLAGLLEMGRAYQSLVGWEASKPNAPSPNERAAAKAKANAAGEVSDGPADAATPGGESEETGAAG